MATKKPEFVSKYKTVDTEVDGISFPVEVLDPSNAEEIEKQKNIRWESVKRTAGLYKEKTEISYSRRVEKLFTLSDENEIIRQIGSDVGPSMTRCFKYRSYADLLEDKLVAIKNPQYVKAVKIAITSLREYGVLHPWLKEICNRIT
jgi:hypothetical protein